MPKKAGGVSRQQQEQERILLSQTPTWLATPQPRNPSPTLGGAVALSPLDDAKCDLTTSAGHPSLLRRVTAPHSSTPPPGGRDAWGATSPIGQRMAAASPFPIAKTPPPRMEPVTSPNGSVATTSPSKGARRNSVGRRGKDDGPGGDLVVRGAEGVVVKGQPPSKQGLHAIVAGNLPRHQQRGGPSPSPGPAPQRAGRPAALPPLQPASLAAGPTSPGAPKRESSPLSPSRPVCTPGGSAVNMLLSAQQPPPSAGGASWDANATFLFAPRTPATSGGHAAHSVQIRSAAVTPTTVHGNKPPPTPFDTGATARGEHLHGAGGGSHVKVTVVDSGGVMHAPGALPGSGHFLGFDATGRSLGSPPSQHSRSGHSPGHHHHQGFHVPDLSDMDPFTLMERGLVEEVARLRSDPKAYAEAVVAPRVVVALPPLPPVQEVPTAPPAAHANDSPHHGGNTSEAPTPTQAGGPSASQVTAALKPTAGSLHPALVPACFHEIAMSARAVRRAQRAHDDELVQIVHREETCFGARMPEAELLGGFYTGLGGVGRDDPADGVPAAQRRLVVPLTDAEQFVRDLQRAVADLRAGTSSISGADANAAAAAQAAKKKGGKGAPEATPSVANAMKPTPQHRRIAVDALTKLHDECASIVADQTTRLRPATHIHHAHDDDNGADRAATPLGVSSGRDGDRDSRATTAADGTDGHGHVIGSGVGYVKGLCMAARDLATLLSNAAAAGALDLDGAGSPTRRQLTKPPTLTTVDIIASQYGKVMEPVHAYVVYGLWHQPHTAVSEVVLRWLHNRCYSHPASIPTASRAPVYIGHGSDPVLFNRAKLAAGAGWQRHSTKGAVTVVLLSTGFQEISYIKQHRNLPVVELRRCFNQGQMARDERVYSLTYIPDHYEIRAVRPVVHPVECGRRVEVTVELPAQVLLSCTVEAGAQESVPGRSQNTTLIDRVGRMARIHAILYDPVPSRLVVYARHPADLNYRRSSTVLLRPSVAKWDADERPGGADDGAVGDNGGNASRHAASRRSMASRGVSRAGRVTTALSSGRHASVAVDAPPTVFPEQFEVFQGLLGHLLCPRNGELLDAATATQDCPTLEIAEAAASQHLPHGVQLGEPARKALHAGGTLFSFRASAEAQEASVTGAHGSVKLHRVAMWRSGPKYDLRPRAGSTAPADTAWFFGVAKLKVGSPITLWVNGQCALQWALPH